MTKFKFSLLLPYVSYRDSKEKLLMYRPNLSCAIMFLSYFPEGFSWEFLVGVCRPVLQIQTLFQTKKYHFPHPFSDPEVVTKRNITCVHKTEIMSSLVRLKLQQKKSHFEFMLHFLSYSFGIETTNTLIHNRSSFVNHTRFQTKTAQKPHPLGVADTFMAYIRESPPVMFQTCFLAYLFH